MVISDVKHVPEIGDYLVPDEWDQHNGSYLEQDSGFKDSSFPGCEFRIAAGGCMNYSLAINIIITGKQHFVSSSRYKSRCKIEFVGDGEASEFTRGWLFH